MKTAIRYQGKRDPIYEGGEYFLQKAILSTALEAYQLHLQTNEHDESERKEITRCREYLENGGEVNNNWLREHAVISNAVSYFHAQLDSKIKEVTDYDLSAVLRVEQRLVSKLHEQLDELQLSN